MSKYNNDWTENKYKRFIKEGRGTGQGRDYKPWWTVQDFPTNGMATRVLSAKTKRIHHFFSDIQLKYFYLLEMEDSVIDIREHFPLLDLEETLPPYTDLKIERFKDKKSQVPYVITTTFLIVTTNGIGEPKYVARAIKAASELKNTTLERLEIERRYWTTKGIDWGIVTNKNINSIRAKNIEWLHTVLTSDDYNGIPAADMEQLSEGLLFRIIESQQPIRKVLVMYERDYMLDPGTGVLLFKYLIIKKRVKIDLNIPINLNAPGISLCLPEITEKGGQSGNELYG